MTGGVPDGFWVVSAAAIGATVGSFLNVCIHRMPRRCMTIAHPPHSRCPKCGHAIRWYENIPILSWLFLLGRCSGCRSQISPLYPAIEALTAAAFALAAYQALAPVTLDDGRVTAAFLRFSAEPWRVQSADLAMRVTWFAIAVTFASGLIVATFVDFEFQIIPDQISITGAWLAPVLSFAWPWLHRPVFELPHMPPANILPWNVPHLEGLAASLLGAAAGAGATWGVGLMGKLVFRKEAMGFGDVKLMAMVGGLLGWKEALAVFFLACVAGSVVGVAMMIVVRTCNAFRSKPIPFDHYLAFGPYLAIGALAVFFFSGELMQGLTAYQRWLQGLFLPRLI